MTGYEALTEERAKFAQDFSDDLTEKIINLCNDETTKRGLATDVLGASVVQGALSYSLASSLVRTFRLTVGDGSTIEQEQMERTFAAILITNIRDLMEKK